MLSSQPQLDRNGSTNVPNTEDKQVPHAELFTFYNLSGPSFICSVNTPQSVRLYPVIQSFQVVQNFTFLSGSASCQRFICADSLN